jgi:hypothetical protein
MAHDLLAAAPATLTPSTELPITPIRACGAHLRR